MTTIKMNASARAFGRRSGNTPAEDLALVLPGGGWSSARFGRMIRKGANNAREERIADQYVAAIVNAAKKTKPAKRKPTKRKPTKRKATKATAPHPAIVRARRLLARLLSR